MIKTGSDFSGVGAFDQALERLGIKQNKVFACDMDKYARQTYILNFGNKSDNEIVNNDDYKKVADIFHREFCDIKLKRPTKEELSFAFANCEFIARQFSFYYPWNVYNRKVSDESLDIYVTTPPCQSFSLAGKRKGEDSKNGVLFYNSHEFIKKNNPRYFIFENVKGLLSDDSGKTFQRWIDYLGGKSVNGNPVIFPHDEATPYHVYYQVMNAKHYGVPQNRERIFIIGIRDDADNEFSFPKPFHLVKRLKDVLETEVDEKYFLSDKMVSSFVRKVKETDWNFEPLNENNEISKCVTSHYAKMGITDNYLKVGFINQDTQASQVFSTNGTSPNICAGTHGYANGYVELEDHFLNPEGIGKSLRCSTGRSLTKKHSYDMIKVVIPANNSKGYNIAEEEEDSINFSNPNSKTRRGRVGHGVSQTLDTACNQGILTQQRIRRLTPKECFALMDFNENFKWNVSDSQAYKQAGNSIVVSCLVEIIRKLKL